MKKMSLAVHTRFFRAYLAAVLLHLSSSFAGAGEDDFFSKDILKTEKMDLPNTRPEWLRTQPAKLDPVLEQVLKEDNKRIMGGQNSQGISGTGLKPKPTQGRWIFVSMAMPPAELKAAAQEASATQSSLVFRGVAKGGDTGSISMRLYQTIKDIKPPPASVIDPTLFTRFGIDAVPTMVETNAQDETRSSRGLPGFRWMAKQGQGDLGKKGPVFGISEPDMVKEMQRRMRDYDWAKEKQHAIDNFWASQKDSVTLPVSDKHTVRMVDPSVIAAKDIFHPDGRMIVQKGTKVNPQALLPMRHAYLLFDATNSRQLDIVKQEGDRLSRQLKPVVYLFSKMDNAKGWEHYNQTQARLNGPIYKLTQAIVDRFKIQCLPTLVEGEGESIKLTEYDSGAQK
jgi:conjugal transfer pilus assembly protein TraW